ncbi:MAG TPA: glycosyltransferase family 2 protein [Longimicrobiaceae bacterium]|nr:glycosyltransferase family 2 protein [Longimicrobiaceae bacterium]
MDLEQALFWLGAVTVAFLAAVIAELVAGGRRLVRLEQVPPLADAEMPAVSIVVPARDEERNLETALRSVLAQRGPRIEVIAVDDRSTDRTGAILDRMAQEDPRLTVVHVAELPPGWLGKNHALWVGAGRARGELLLFTDADVVMAPDTVHRAAGHLVRERLDHVTAGPRVEMPGRLLQAFGVVFGLFFAMFTRPWRVRDPRSRHHVGIGAFNLVRTQAYHAIGGHRAIAMRPDDDMKLGKLVKKHGLRQDLVIGTALISVEWYRTVGEAARGLRKNGFAGLDYRLSVVVLATVVHLLFFLWPFAAVLVVAAPARWLYLAAVACILVLFAGAARDQRVPAWYGVFFPLASLLFVYVVWNATLYALVHRGIEWRGTHYPLDQLKANRV